LNPTAAAFISTIALRALQFENGRATSCDFGSEDQAPLSEQDTVILVAVPQWVAETLVPDLSVPTEHRAIVNAHYRVAPPPHFPEILGVINATVEWIFAFPGRLSITISGADRVIDRPREGLAADLWREVSSLTGLSSELPPWQIVKEKRATFAALPEQDARRPGAKTKWRNLFLAGDWTQTGLPSTIEGAIRSGERAARLTMKGY
jgi:hydroxysqualene dehydroxylase